MLQDIEISNWLDAKVKRQADGSTMLLNYRVIDPTIENPTHKIQPNEDESIQIVGEVTETNPGMLFTINWLPLGGFVKIRGEGDTSIPEGLAAANPWKRLVVYAFGPMMNLLLGVILFAVIGSKIGIDDYSQVLIVHVSSNSPAEAAGLKMGDIIKDFNGKSIDSIEKLQEYVEEKKGEEIQLGFLREGETQVVTLTPRINHPANEGSMGVGLSHPLKKATLVQAIPWGFQMVYNQTRFLLTIPAQLFKGDSAEDARLVGYKGMYDMYAYIQDIEIAPDIPKYINTISFIITITLSLGILNLLPIPALDGGRILFALPEIIIRRKIPIEIQNLVNMISFTVMILLFIYINILDFVKPIQLP
jgi:regulator of sigma E protease